jgi:hypothetical protein
MRGITGLRGYQRGGVTSREEHRRRAMAGEEGYATIGPTPSWTERVAAQVRSVPRRINRALQPETAGETAALVGASMAEPLGTGIDIADIIAGARTLDFPRIGWGAAGLATPFVAGSAMRQMAKRGGVNTLPSRIARKWEDMRLPMDEASVARRMEEQGYEELLHGTGRGGQALDPNAPLDPNRPFFQVDNPDVAEAYGEVRKVYSRKPNQIAFDAEGAPWADIPIEKIRGQIDPSRLEEFDRLAYNPDYSWRPSGEKNLDTDSLSKILQEMGYSGFDAQNLRDAPLSGLRRVAGDVADAPSFVRSTIDPGLVRYEGARFNPRDLGLNRQLAGIAPLLGLGAAGAARRNYVERER